MGESILMIFWDVVGGIGGWCDGIIFSLFCEV
jgi:hypothetical protein